MKLAVSYTLLLVCLLLKPEGLLAANEIAGKVLKTAGPYLLLETAAEQRVVRTDSWTAYGNLTGMGELKAGGETVTVSYELEVARVPQALSISKTTDYQLNPDLQSTADVVAAGIKSGSLLLVDSRSQEEWDEAHLFGAVTVQAFKVMQPQQSKNMDIVIYGSSASDMRPFRVARLFSANGYNKIKVFAGGVKEWRRQGRAINAAPSHLVALLENGKAFRVIDLRQPSHVNTLLMNGTETLPVASWSRSKVVLPDRAYQMPLFLYGDENELQTAAGLLAEWGYHNDGDFALLDSSWKEWTGKYTLVKYRPGEPPSEEISLQEFRTLWIGGESNRAVLLNVKQKRDREFPGEIHIPLEELPEKLENLPRDREIIIYCSVGLRSSIAQRILQSNGFSSRFLNRILRFDENKKPI